MTFLHQLKLPRRQDVAQILVRPQACRIIPFTHAAILSEGLVKEPTTKALLHSVMLIKEHDKVRTYGQRGKLLLLHCMYPTWFVVGL